MREAHSPSNTTLQPLPPTHDVHLSGVPGFNATIDYSVSASVTRSKTSSLLRLGGWSVTHIFACVCVELTNRVQDCVYAVQLPPSISPRRTVACTDAAILRDVQVHRDSGMAMLGVVDEGATAGGKGHHVSGSCVCDVVTSRSSRMTLGQLYLPASRVFSITQPIPYHVMFGSSAFSLAAFLPYGPTATILAPNKYFTRIRVLRQSIVDVRYAALRSSSFAPASLTQSCPGTHLSWGRRLTSGGWTSLAKESSNMR